MTWDGALHGIIAAIAYGLVLLVALRLSHRSPSVIVLASGVAIYVAAALAFLLLGQTVLFWTYSTLYWFLVLCFLIAFGAIYKSLSLRILSDLVDLPGQTVSADELGRRYVFGESFSNRLDIAVGSGLAARSGQGYVLTSRGAALAQRVRSLQRAFGILKSG